MLDLNVAAAMREADKVDYDLRWSEILPIIVAALGGEPLYRFIEDKASRRRVYEKCTIGTCPHDMWSDHRCMVQVWPKEATNE